MSMHGQQKSRQIEKLTWYTTVRIHNFIDRSLEVGKVHIDAFIGNAKLLENDHNFRGVRGEG